MPENNHQDLHVSPDVQDPERDWYAGRESIPRRRHTDHPFAFKHSHRAIKLIGAGGALGLLVLLALTACTNDPNAQFCRGSVHKDCVEPVDMDLTFNGRPWHF